MKSLIFLIVFLISIQLNAQQTYVPDDNFEQALIDLGYDSGVPDDYVPTANISGLTSLDVYNKNISDLTGIEDFSALTDLFCDNNQLTSLDLSANTDLAFLFCYNNQIENLNISNNVLLSFLWCNNNMLTNLDLSNNTSLADLNCSDNQLLNLDLSTNSALSLLACYNNQLTGLDVSNNTDLGYLGCFNNQLNDLDVRNCSALTSLYCYNCQLTGLDVRNGNNILINNFTATDNPNLKCILVDDTEYSISNWTGIDPTSTFVESEAECDALGINKLFDINFIIFPNPVEEYFQIQTDEEINKVKIYDISGKLLIIYNKQEKYRVKHLPTGLFLLEIVTEKGTVHSKLLLD